MSVVGKSQLIAEPPCARAWSSIPKRKWRHRTSLCTSLHSFLVGVRRNEFIPSPLLVSKGFRSDSLPRMLSSFTTCTYSAQFFNARHSNWITKLSESRLLRKRIASCQCNGLNTREWMIWLILLRATAKHFLSMHCKKALSNSKRNERNTSFCFIVAFQFRWTGQSSSY